MKNVELDYFPPNLRRKIRSENYEVDKYRRVNLLEKTRAAKFEQLRDKKEELTENDLRSDNATLQFAIDLAWQKLHEMTEKPQKELENIAET